MSRIDELIEQIRVLEEETQNEFDKKREDFHFVMDQKRARFSEEVAALQRGSKTGLFRYMTGASLLSWLVAPVIYSGFVLMLLLDLFLFIYQAICFPVYHITKAKRSDYVILDRGDLPYLNILEKFNCFYCGYANGLMSYGREVAARTEQFFCPIKHARRICAAHDHYANFFEFGDAASYRHGLERLRDALAASQDGH
ncbi:MAG TPA: hypothetical protein VIL41_06515 [Coriobacteriia bacterium]